MLQAIAYHEEVYVEQEIVGGNLVVDVDDLGVQKLNFLIDHVFLSDQIRNFVFVLLVLLLHVRDLVLYLLALLLQGNDLLADLAGGRRSFSSPPE